MKEKERLPQVPAALLHLANWCFSSRAESTRLVPQGAETYLYGILRAEQGKLTHKLCKYQLWVLFRILLIIFQIHYFKPVKENCPRAKARKLGTGLCSCFLSLSAIHIFHS